MGSLLDKHLNTRFKLKPEFFFSGSADQLRLINVADDDTTIYQFSGPCTEVFKDIAKGTTPAEIKALLLQKSGMVSAQEVDSFLENFLTELTAMGIFDN